MTADGWTEVYDATAELLATCRLDPSDVLARAAARVPDAEVVCSDASTFLGADHRSWDLVAARD